MDIERNKIILKYLQDDMEAKKKLYFDSLYIFNQFVEYTLESATDPLREQRAMWVADMQKKENAGQGLKEEIEQNAVPDNLFNTEVDLKTFVEQYRRVGPGHFFLKKMEDQRRIGLTEAIARKMENDLKNSMFNFKADKVESGSIPISEIPNPDQGYVKKDPVVVFQTVEKISEETRKFVSKTHPVRSLRNELQEKMIKAIQEQGELCIREFKDEELNCFEKHNKNVVYLPKAQMDIIINSIYKTDADLKSEESFSEFFHRKWNEQNQKTTEQMIKDGELPQV